VTGAGRLRLLFVGQSTYFWNCAFDQPTAGIEPHYVDFRAGDDPGRLNAALTDLAPDVVVVFRPEIVPAGMFHGLRALTLGFFTEPLPRPGPDDAHPDLLGRLEDLRLADPSNFDRVVAFDPLVAETADAITPIWRAVPLPVNDSIYGPVRDAEGRRFGFFGYWTPRRERFLVDSKHLFDVLHVDFGAVGQRLVDYYDRVWVGLNVHNQDYPTFENRVPMHLAAGHLVVSEPLSPLHGLEPGIDFLEAATPDQLTLILGQLARFPGLHQRVRLRGRRKAEHFRASRVYARLIADLHRDLAAFGSIRPGSPARL
jgi:hypothetical protein